MIDGDREAEKIAGRFRSYVENPVLTNVKVAFDGFQTYDVQQSNGVIHVIDQVILPPAD